VGLRQWRARFAPATPSLWARLLHWWTRDAAPQGLRLAQGLAFGLMLGIGATTLWHTQRGIEPAESRSVAPSGTALLRASAKAGVKESDLRLALIAARVTIVAGPTRLGDYYLRVPAGQIDAARATLQRSNAFERIDAVADLPEELRE
jgi:hypothetical protein